MIRAHKIALDPTCEQALLMARTCGYARVARNMALADFKAGLDEGMWRSVPELKRRFNAAKDEALSWCRDLSQHAAKNAIMDSGQGIRELAARPQEAEEATAFSLPEVSQARRAGFIPCQQWRRYGASEWQSGDASQSRRRQDARGPALCGQREGGNGKP